MSYIDFKITGIGLATFSLGDYSAKEGEKVQRIIDAMSKAIECRRQGRVGKPCCHTEDVVKWTFEQGSGAWSVVEESTVRENAGRAWCSRCWREP